MNERKLRVLVAEGNPGETAPILRALYPEPQDGLELTVVSGVSILIATLDIVNPEVIFLDLALAHPSPMDAVRRVHRSAPTVPLIIVAGASDKNLAVSSLTHGAQDYLLRGFIDSRTIERVLRTAWSKTLSRVWPICFGIPSRDCIPAMVFSPLARAPWKWRKAERARWSCSA